MFHSIYSKYNKILLKISLFLNKNFQIYIMSNSYFNRLSFL